MTAFSGSPRLLLALCTGAWLAACAQGTIADSGTPVPRDGGDAARTDGPPVGMDTPPPPPDSTPPPPDGAPPPPDAMRECASSAECAGSRGGPVCDTARGVCVPCTAMEDRCPTGQRCNAMNACVPGCRSDMDCMAGSTRCDPMTNQCVGCTADTDCALGSVCRMSACVPGCSPTRGCTAGNTCCAGTCVNTQSDTANCGGCGTACGAGGMCCAGTCASTASDVRNCGACGNVCTLPRATASCAAGACAVMMCTFGFGDCNGTAADGCETALNDNANCGMCGRACGAGTMCMGGTCASICAPGLTFCAGACVNTGSDAANCGMCGRACGAGMMCSGGTCMTSCSAGLTLCGTTCVNLSTDAANCGACARACAAGQVCTAGTCTATAPGNDRCNTATAMTIGATVSGTTVGAVNDYGSSCGAGGASPDVAYSFVSDGSPRTVTITSNTTVHDGVLHAHANVACAPGDEIVCNDDFGGTRSSQIAFMPPQGMVYVVQDGYSSGNSGPFTLSSSSAVINHDTCATPARISANGTYTGSTAGRAANYTATCGSGTNTAPDVVYAITARASGTITAALCGSSYDTVLYVSTTCGSSTTCNDDSCGLSSSISFPVTAGTTYYLVVDGYNGQSGNYTLSITGY